MGAIDHLVLAMGISLSRLNGRDAVALLTSDARMAHAARRAGSLTRTAADEAHSPGSDPAADEARKAGRYVRIHST
jgi:hypothetical protein